MAVSVRAARLAGLTNEWKIWWTKASKGSLRRPGFIAPDAVIHTVRANSPDDAVAIFDAGNPGVWSYLWEIRHRNTYLKPVGYGNMGFSIPAAIGVKMMLPDRAVVVFVGDRSLGMVEDEEALSDVLAQAKRTEGPFLIEVMIDPDVNAWAFELFRQYEVGD